MLDPGGLRQEVNKLRFEEYGSSAELAQVNEQLLSQEKRENPAQVQVARAARRLNACSIPAFDWVHTPTVDDLGAKEIFAKCHARVTHLRTHADSAENSCLSKQTGLRESKIPRKPARGSATEKARFF